MGAEDGTWRWLAGLLRQAGGWDRRLKQACMIACDVVLLAGCAWAAFSVRLGPAFGPTTEQVLFVALAPLVAVPVFVRVGLYRSVIRYLGEQALWAVCKGMVAAAVLWAALAFMTEATGHEGVPRSVPVLYGMFGLVLVTGVRFAARWLLWLPLRRRFPEGQVLIYGAGGAGRQLAGSLRAGRGRFPAGFLDDDPSLAGTDVDGLRVYAPGDLSELVDRFDIQEVIVCLPSSSAARRREVVQWLERFPVRVRMLPALSDIASGRHLVSLVREVDIGDLLGRDPVRPDPELLAGSVRGKVVLVTGAGGSIGSELCRQIITLAPATLVMVDASEAALYEIDRRIRPAGGERVHACLGTVEDATLLARLFRQHRIQTVYHAAAHKHVPLVELNPLEGVANNILGTRELVEAALAHEVESFVLISTDKAVRPTNVMGASKRWAELIVLDAARRAGRRGRYSAVRFGNVLGSSGSVIPLFREQIASGGPVTVTHPQVNRYFMSVHEAVELVIQAATLAQGGEIFLLEMGEPVKIADLAERMIRLAGLEVRDEAHPEGDIAIEFTGLRPGEKLFEELWVAEDTVVGTPHSKVMKVMAPSADPAMLGSALARLCRLIENGGETAVAKCVLDGAYGRWSEAVGSEPHGAIAGECGPTVVAACVDGPDVSSISPTAISNG